MAHVVPRRAPLGIEAPGRRRRERPLGVVLQRAEQVVDEEVGALPAPALLRRPHLRRRQRDLHERGQRLLAEAGVADDLDQVADGRVRPDPGDRRVQVEAAQHPRAGHVRVGHAEARERVERIVDAAAQPEVPRHLQIVGEQVFVDRRHQPDVARIGIRRVDDVELLLAEAVDS